MIFRNWKRTAKMLSKTLNNEVEKRLESQRAFDELSELYDNLIRSHMNLVDDNVKIKKELAEAKEELKTIILRSQEYQEDAFNWEQTARRESMEKAAAQEALEALKNEQIH